MPASAQLKRKRSRVACEPCRERKRKCNGGNPCMTCVNWGYECFYEGHFEPKISRLSESARPTLLEAPPAERLSQGREPAELQNVFRCIEANSGAAFVRRMGLKVDPANAPKLNLFGWNIGPRQLPSGLGPICAYPIVDILSRTDMESLARIYFSRVHPCYGFIDRQQFYERLDARWASPLTRDPYDGVLSGVAALGSLFSERSATITELNLVEAARSILDINGLSGTPSVDFVTGWTLRVVYMRITAPPHSAWIASSTLMHLIEASGLHLESSIETVLSRGTQCDQDLQRRLVGVAQHLNMWISYDLGLSRVSLQSSLPSLPVPRPDDYTTELLGLLPATENLDPEKAQDGKDLESSLLQVLSRTHTEPPSVLAQCNLLLCLLRRLCALHVNISTVANGDILSLLKKGLQAARTLVVNCCPWQHIANVPFHTICILLDMDTNSSLEVLPEAMQTLKLVASSYNTSTVREAYDTARLIVFLYQRRRSEDAKFLRDLLDKCEEQPESSLPSRQTGSAFEEVSWLEGLIADMPSLQGFDLSQFLQDQSPGPPLDTGLSEPTYLP
ncbi:protein RDR1 [Aspergillus udagawae]|nr:protein RDR1 [Aspergillus udagawae]